MVLDNLFKIGSLEVVNPQTCPFCDGKTTTNSIPENAADHQKHK